MTLIKNARLLWRSPIKFYQSDIFPLEKAYQEDEDWDIFRDIYYRAHIIISSFEHEAINKEAEIARNALFSIDRLSMSPESGFMDEIPEAHARGILNLSYAYRIKHGYKFFKSEKFAVNHWDLFFALIALYEIDTCMLIQQTMNTGRITYPKYNKREHFHAYAQSALESVIYAENDIELSDEVLKQVKETTSERARQAAFKRHEKTQDICHQFIRFYEEGDFKTKSSAADKFLKINASAETVLAPTNAKRTLLDALRKYQKSLTEFE